MRIKFGRYDPLNIIDLLIGFLLGILLGVNLTVGNWKVQLRTKAELQDLTDAYMAGRIEQGKNDLEIVRGKR